MILLILHIFLLTLPCLFVFYLFNKKGIKVYDVSLKCIMLLSLFSIPLTYIILWLGRILSNRYLEFKIGSSDGWLGFIGSIIGSIITMVALVISLNSERANRREDKFADSIAFISLEEIRESSETIGAGDGFLFNHLIELKNNSNTPALNFELNLESSKFTYLDSDNHPKEIYLKELDPTHNNKVYIPPNGAYTYTLRMRASDKIANNFGLFNNNTIEIEDFKLRLVFNYNGIYSLNKKIEYIINIDRYQTSMREYGFIENITTIQTDESRTPLFKENIVQEIKIPKYQS